MTALPTVPTATLNAVASYTHGLHISKLVVW